MRRRSSSAGPIAQIEAVGHDGALELRLAPTVRALELEIPVLAHRRGNVVDPGAVAIE